MMRIYLMTSSNNDCGWFTVYLNTPHHMRRLLAINRSVSVQTKQYYLHFFTFNSLSSET